MHFLILLKYSRLVQLRVRGAHLLIKAKNDWRDGRPQVAMRR